jgi:hypothetical protein
MSTCVSGIVRPDGRCLVRCAGGWTRAAAAEAHVVFEVQQALDVLGEARPPVAVSVRSACVRTVLELVYVPRVQELSHAG